MSLDTGYIFRTVFNPIQGIDEDIGEFIREFERAGSIRFTEFAQLWKKHKFIYLIYGRQSQHGLYDILGCILHRLVDLVQPSSDRTDLARVCALYLIYSFHGKQPIRNHVRVRVCPASWPGIVQLATEARDQGHLDVYYVFRQLCLSNAVHFCGNRQVLYPAVPLFNKPQLAQSELPLEDYNDTLKQSESIRTGQFGAISSGHCPLSLYLQLLRPSKESNGDINDFDQTVRCLDAAVNRYVDSKQLLNPTDQTSRYDNEGKLGNNDDGGEDATSDEKFLPGLNFIKYPDSLERIHEIVTQLREQESQSKLPKRSRLSQGDTFLNLECSDTEDGDIANRTSDSNEINDLNIPVQSTSKNSIFVKPGRIQQASASGQFEVDDEVGANRRILKKPRTWSTELVLQRENLLAHGHHIDRRRPSEPKLPSTVVYGGGDVNPRSNT